MDRGNPTEETLAGMRGGPAPVHRLVGTSKGRLSKLRKAFVSLSWRAVRVRLEPSSDPEAGATLTLPGGRRIMPAGARIC